jgi:ABC-type antimicrobial peptide transport system permease subunit
VDETLIQERLLAKLAGMFGTLALALAAVGLYGILAYTVARRTSEIGLRVALGARPGQVVALVMRECVWVIGLGLLTGVPAALVAGRWIENQLFGLRPGDPGTLALAAALLLGTGLIAAFLPAWRAARLAPMRALRQE